MMDCYQEYERYLAEEKKVASNTLSSYLRDIRQFLHWLERAGKLPEQVKRPDVASYTQFLSSEGK